MSLFPFLVGSANFCYLPSMPIHRKIFVLDTNVILHDCTCIHKFKDNDIVIPITVLEELDKFKKGNESINFHAREFVRIIDALSEEKLFNTGVKFGEGRGRISVHIDHEFHSDLHFSFSSSKPDHQILNCCYIAARSNPNRRVVLITKDVNLRMKARSLGLFTEDYHNDQVPEVSLGYKGWSFLEGVPLESIDTLYGSPSEIEAESLSLKAKPIANQYLVLRGHGKSVLGRYMIQDDKVVRVDKTVCYGIKPRNAEQTFALDALTDPTLPLVTITGKAGTGKTLLALAAALERRQLYRQIYIARPVVPLSNKDIGYLPGDIKSKLDPYMQPLFDNLSVIQNQFGRGDAQYTRITELVQEEKLKISPLSYIRGRSLVQVFFIIDEAQNLTPHEVKTIITRAGEGTKIVFTGDIYQIDHPYLDSQSNGLSYLMEKMRNQALYAHINLEKGERSRLADLASQLL